MLFSDYSRTVANGNSGITAAIRTRNNVEQQ